MIEASSTPEQSGQVGVTNPAYKFAVFFSDSSLTSGAITIFLPQKIKLYLDHLNNSFQ